MSEQHITLIEEAKADMVRKHEVLRRMPLHKPKAWAYWVWFFALLIVGLWCLFNALALMYLGDSWRMLYSYTMFLVNAATLTVHHEGYRKAMVDYLTRRGEMELLDRFVAHMIADYDADIARLREASK